MSLENFDAAKESGVDVLAVHDALEKLARVNARQAQLVELRFFGGTSMEEAATVLGVSKTTVESEWRTARAWLARELASAKQAE